MALLEKPNLSRNTFWESRNISAFTNRASSSLGNEILDIS